MLSCEILPLPLGEIQLVFKIYYPARELIYLHLYDFSQYTSKKSNNKKEV